MSRSFLFIFAFFVVSTKCSTSDDDLCSSQLELLEEALMLGNGWAVEMFDTWAKNDIGVLSGNLNNPGMFKKCINFRHQPADVNEKVIRGQHCMVSFENNRNETISPLDSNFSWQRVFSKGVVITKGICLPASCSPEIIKNVSLKYLDLDDFNATRAVCRSDEQPKFLALDVLAICVFAIFLIVIISSTAFDVVMTRKMRDPNKLLIAFSAFTNGAALFNTSKSESKNSINCLNGIRVLSIFWIVFGHRLDERFMIPAINSDEVFSFPEKPISLIHSTFTLGVDTFFLMGGLLTTWSFMNALERKSVNLPRMYLHRYLRYTPLLMALILFFITMPKFLGNGPFFDLDGYVPQCEKYWWSAMLHIQNYVNPNELCLDWSWYLSVDFQLFLISPLLIFPLWRWKWKFFWVLPTIVLLSQGCIFASSYSNEILVFVGRMIPIPGKEPWERLIYFPTHARMGPWIIGVMLGYIMYTSRSKTVEICKTKSLALWILSLGILIAIVVCYYPFQRSEEHNTTTIFGNALYNAVFRVGWSCGVAWIIFACQNGSGGVIRWFLSLPQWQPVARMGLSIYLVHRMYQIVTILSQKQPLYFEFMTQLHKFYGDIVVSLVLGTVLYLTFEVPFLLIENYLYKKIKSKK